MIKPNKMIDEFEIEIDDDEIARDQKKTDKNLSGAGIA